MLTKLLPAVLRCYFAHQHTYLNLIKGNIGMGRALPSEEITVRCVQHVATRLNHSDG